ncbi:MAG: hypothetical protein M1817_004544 [Caeruleum heppii]|nr:MAG: hypothetical protein M1817_004544 [Caeruleum heppii]
MADSINCRKWITRKQKDYTRMLSDATLTPRLEDRLAQTIAVFSSALALQETNAIVPLTRSLKKLDKEIEDLYADTFGSMTKSAGLLLHLDAVRGFVRVILYDDYGEDARFSLRRSTNVNDYVITGRVLSGSEGRLQVARSYNRPEVDDPRVTETMRQRVRDAAKELLIDDQELAEEFVAFAKRSGRRRNRVKELVDWCDWTELATRLDKDRKDLTRIVPRRERLEASRRHRDATKGDEVVSTWHEEIGNRITILEGLYFDQLSNACRPSALAKRLTEKRKMVERAAQVEEEQRLARGREMKAASINVTRLKRAQTLPNMSHMAPSEKKDLPPLPPFGESNENLAESRSPHEKRGAGRRDDDGQSDGIEEDAPPRYSEVSPLHKDRASTSGSRSGSPRDGQRRSLPGLVGRLFGGK